MKLDLPHPGAPIIRTFIGLDSDSLVWNHRISTGADTEYKTGLTAAPSSHGGSPKKTGHDRKEN